MSEGTEEAAVRYRGLDTWGTAEILSALWGGQTAAAAACLPALRPLARAVDAAAERLSSGGRLVYVGVGSSGLIAALDASELGATFDWPARRMCLVLPAGLDLSRDQAGAIEDDAEAGAERIDGLGVGRDDVVVGSSASGRSAFTIGALSHARERGALTIAFANVGGSPLASVAAHAVAAETGAEVIAGSTRLGAGTAQKILFNLFSTALMTRLGAVHDNLMINVRPGNKKLRARCAAMVSAVARVEAERAREALDRAGTVKRAVLALSGVPDGEIDARLEAAGGNLRRALSAGENAK